MCDRIVIGGRCVGVRRVPLRVEESALNFLGGASMTVEASLRVPHPLGPGGLHFVYRIRSCRLKNTARLLQSRTYTNTYFLSNYDTGPRIPFFLFRSGKNFSSEFFSGEKKESVVKKNSTSTIVSIFSPDRPQPQSVEYFSWRKKDQKKRTR